GERALRNLELEVELAELEVRGRHIADQRGHDEAPRVLAGEQIAPRRLRGPPETTPEVELPGEVEGAHGTERRLELQRRPITENPRVGRARVSGDVRELEGAVDGNLGPRVEDPRRGNPQIVVRAEGSTQELLEHRVLENLPPGQIADRFFARGNIRRLPAEIGRDLDLRALVIGPDGAPGQQQCGREENEWSHACCLPGA